MAGNDAIDDGGAAPSGPADPLPYWATDPQRMEQRYLRLLGLMDETLSIVDDQLQFRFTTAVLNQALDHPTETWEGLNALSIVHPDDQQRMIETWIELSSGPGVRVENEARLLKADGSWVEVLGRAINLTDDPLIDGIVLTTHNISAQRRAERLNDRQTKVLELVARQASLSDALDAVHGLVADNSGATQTSLWLFDDDRITHRAGWSDPDVEAVLVAQVNDLTPRPWARKAPTSQLIVVDDLVDIASPAMARSLHRAGLTSAWVCPLLAADCSRLVGVLVEFHAEARQPDDHDGRVAEVAAALVSLAVEVSGVNERLAFLAKRDALTGLANRSELMERARQILLTGQEHTMLLCDLNGFKPINDLHGHRAGDRVLIAVANRLAEQCTESDLLARLGGDEFVIITATADPAAVDDLVARLKAAIVAPIRLDFGAEVTVGTAVGTSSSVGQTSAGSWIHDADVAMYQDKGWRRR